MFLAVTVDVSPVAVVCTLTEFGLASDPVASMTSTPAFFSTKFWYTLLRRVISFVCLFVCSFVHLCIGRRKRGRRVECMYWLAKHRGYLHDKLHTKKYICI